MLKVFLFSYSVRLNELRYKYDYGRLDRIISLIGFSIHISFTFYIFFLSNVVLSYSSLNYLDCEIGTMTDDWIGLDWIIVGSIMFVHLDTCSV